MNDGCVVAKNGQERIGATQDAEGGRARFTVVVFASSDGLAEAPEVRYKGVRPSRLRGIRLGKVPPGVAWRFPKSGGYDERSSLATSGEIFPQKMIARVPGKPRRDLSADHFTGHLTRAVVGKLPASRRAPIAIWGRRAPPLQVANRYRNKALKQKCENIQTLHVADYLEKQPNGNPRLARTKILYVAAKTHNRIWSGRNFMARARKQFRKTETCVARGWSMGRAY